MEEFIKQNLLPLTLPITSESLKLLKDDKRNIVLTIFEDETHYESKKFIKLLRAAASANREFVFAYVGFNQWQDFAEAFEVGRKTSLPKMVVWDGNEIFSTVSCFRLLNGLKWVGLSYANWLKTCCVRVYLFYPFS